MPRPRPAALAAALTALLVPAALVVATQADAALPKAPGATVPPVVPSVATIGGLTVENSFVSHTGWVKPGDTYPTRILVKSTTASTPAATVRVTETRGMHFVSARATIGKATLSGGVVTWSVPALPSSTSGALILDNKALTAAQEPTIAWRNISAAASVTVGSAKGVLRSHGPKVIPPDGTYDTARFGDRPFPVVPVDYVDFQHTRPSSKLDNVLNSTTNKASTFSLYQEMSYGQLFPHGTIPSVALKDRDYSEDAGALRFSTLQPLAANTCGGTSLVNPVDGTPLPTYTKRITDGWYQLPGTRGWYGSDGKGSAIVGSLAGVGTLQDIDSGCGPTAKMAYDAAVVADPDIDYSDFDTDKDGVVDFFEVIFEGCGGNGDSQLNTDNARCNGVAYDNVWPHSSSLENTYVDAKTGLTGYISHDQLKDYEGNKLWYADTTYKKFTKKDMGKDMIAYVRVGPYNVNPETAIDRASVISHEYGHSLGLPDYYSTGSRETYGDWNIMATDKSHNMDIVAKKEMGWVVPDVLTRGTSTKAKGWHDTKLDTGTIHWVTPQGKPYTLSAAKGDYGIHNGRAYTAALPGRQLLDPKLITANGGKQVWYSDQGNGFGCAPTGGHNLDIVVPGLDRLPSGTTVTLSFKSLWAMEWDFDYGFVMTGTPDSNGTYSYTALASANNYSTPAVLNPNQNGCLTKYGNGLTGTSASYAAGTSTADRLAGTYDTPTFVDDSYDISSLAGVRNGVIRFSYSTDPGVAKLGWIIDNLKVVAGGKTIYTNDFESSDESEDPNVYPGGCREDLTTSGGVCTSGFKLLQAGTPGSQEHAYLMEMRDRSGFDFDGRGQNDRDPIAFQPGLLLAYTDEAHGYGNTGTDDPPAQSPLDANPTQNSETPNLNDAAFTAARSTYSDAKSNPHKDNYTMPVESADKTSTTTGPWTFAYDCLGFHVDKMDGDTGNSAEAYDLVGDVSLKAGLGCAKFNYGWTAKDVAARPVVVPPVVTPPTTPTTPRGGGSLPATGGLGWPAVALALLGGAWVVRRRLAA